MSGEKQREKEFKAHGVYVEEAPKASTLTKLTRGEGTVRRENCTQTQVTKAEASPAPS